MKKIVALILFVSLITSTASAQNASKFGESFAPLVEKLMGGVVNISTIHNTKGSEDKPDIISANEFINNYFVQDDGGYTSLGSGFLIDSQGYIITNNHVIEGANEVFVKTSDNTQYKAKVIGVDKMTDIALIKIDSDKAFDYVKIGDSDELKIGDWILAIGNPFGLGSSVTAGIVSAKSRDIDAGSYDNFIQTDASINQGSSGGPMFNMSGEVVGINTALYSTSGTSMGIGFATPVNLAKFVVSELKNKGLVERGWLGLKVMDNTKDVSLSDNQNFKGGVVINSIIPSSPSDNNQINVGDIILSVNGKNIKNAKGFSRSVAESNIGSEVILRIWRNNQTKDINMKIAKMPDIKKQNTPKQTVSDTQLPKGYVSDLGVILTDGNNEVIVEDVLGDSDAFIKGLKSGDVIKKINDKDIASINDVEAYVGYAKSSDNKLIKIDIFSDNIPQTINVSIKNND